MPAMWNAKQEVVPKARAVQSVVRSPLMGLRCRARRAPPRVSSSAREQCAPRTASMPRRRATAIGQRGMIAISMVIILVLAHELDRGAKQDAIEQGVVGRKLVKCVGMKA